MTNQSALSESTPSHMRLRLCIRFREKYPLDWIRALRPLPKSELELIRQSLSDRSLVSETDMNAQSLANFALWLSEKIDSATTQIAISVTQSFAYERRKVTQCLINHVCEFAGHAWLLREDGRIAHFLPDVEEMPHAEKDEIPIEDVINGLLDPLYDSLGVLGRVFNSGPDDGSQSDVVDSTLRSISSRLPDSPSWEDGLAHLVPVPAESAENLPPDLREGHNYSFTPSPVQNGKRSHNCMTWACAVLDRKNFDWFDNHPIQDVKAPLQLKEMMFVNGKMNEIRNVFPKKGPR